MSNHSDVASFQGSKELVDSEVIDLDAEFGGLEARKELERKLLWKLDLRMSILVLIYILNYVCSFTSRCLILISLTLTRLTGIMLGMLFSSTSDILLTMNCYKCRAFKRINHRPSSRGPTVCDAVVHSICWIHHHADSLQHVS